LGRLGSGEFDVLSDADILFVRQPDLDYEALTRAAEQIVQALAAYTRDGMLFPVDARLRPHGGEGDLLVTPEQLESYFDQEALGWEALTYTKLRFLAGSRSLGDRAMAAVGVLFRRFSDDASFATAICEMRSKLLSAELSLKTSPGGSYDIDFLTGYLLVKHGITPKGGNLRDRLWRCAAAGVLDKADAAALDHGAELLRTVDHVMRLTTGRNRKWLPSAEHARQVCEKLTAQTLATEFPKGLEVELEQTCRKVRCIFDRYLSSATNC
jgi:glutamate-ammonia-ligase adenylyltransferase